MAEEGAYFERLVELLDGYGFNWLVVQVQAEIAEGKVISKEVDALEIVQSIETDTFVRRTPRRRRTSLVATEPYSDAERLDILLRSLEAAIAGRFDLEQAVLETVRDVSAIEFRPEDTGTRSDDLGGQRSHRVTRDRLPDGNSVHDALVLGIRLLRESIDAGP